MTVLSIIGIIAAIWFAYISIKNYNINTYEQYRYKFFDWDSYFIIAISYAFMFFGRMNYFEALKDGGDILNGQVLIGMGILGLAYMLLVNIKSTSIYTGITGTIYQLIVYSVLAVVGIFAMFAAFIFFADTKPVYNIN